MKAFPLVLLLTFAVALPAQPASAAGAGKEGDCYYVETTSRVTYCPPDAGELIDDVKVPRFYGGCLYLSQDATAPIFCVDDLPGYSDGCVYDRNGNDVFCAPDAEPVCDGTPEYPCVDTSPACVRFSYWNDYCVNDLTPEPVCDDSHENAPCVDVTPTSDPCLWVTSTFSVCRSDVPTLSPEPICDATPQYPCVGTSPVCVRTSATYAACQPDTTCDPCPAPVRVDCSGPDCAPGVGPNSAAPYGRTVTVDEQAVGYGTVVAPQTVTVPSYTVVPERDPQTLLVPVPYLGPQDVSTPPVGVPGRDPQRVCAPNDYVCYTTPAVPGANVPGQHVVTTPGVGGPVPVTVPGNDEVSTPGKTVTTPRLPVGLWIHVGGSVWLGWPGGSVGPVNQGGLEVCASGCPYTGVPDYDADPVFYVEQQQ